MGSASLFSQPAPQLTMPTRYEVPSKEQTKGLPVTSCGRWGVNRIRAARQGLGGQAWLKEPPRHPPSYPRTPLPLHPHPTSSSAHSSPLPPSHGLSLVCAHLSLPSPPHLLCLLGVSGERRKGQDTHIAELLLLGSKAQIIWEVMIQTGEEMVEKL